MGLVSTWLTGCGLSHAIPNFTAAGIVTPSALAELDLAHYEALGVSSPEDRRKLFYLVQRIKLAVDKERKEDTSTKETTTGASLEEQVDALVHATTSTQMSSSSVKSTASPSKENESPLGLGDMQSHGEPTRQDQEALRTPSKKQSPSSIPSKGSPAKGTPSPSRIPAPSTKRSPSKVPSPKSSILSDVTSPGQTTSPVKSPTKPKPTKKDSSSDDADGSSTWEDGEEDECADDEASIAVTKMTATTRRSKRLAGKTKAITASARTAKRSVSPKKPTLAKAKIVSSGMKTPQTRAGKGSTLPRPAARPTRSQLQNPSRSMRTGKQLSTIPADSTLPMSPLTKMPPPQLEAEKPAKEAKPRYGIPGRTGISSRSVKSKSRRSLSGSVSDHSDSEGSSTKVRSRRTTMGGHSSRSGSMSDSDSSVSRRRRQSLQAPKAKSGVTKGRTSDIGVRKISTRPTSTKSTRTTGTGSGIASKKPSKGRMTHGGTNSDSSWKAQIDVLRAEVDLDHELFSDSVFFDEDGEDDLIRVIVRKRPFSADKPSDIDCIHPLEYGYYGKMLVYQPTTRVDLTKEINAVPFAYDGVFGEEYNNLQIYEKSVRNLIPVVLDGQHATVFAFGCTGSGKTHTMMGSAFTSQRSAAEENMGLYYMAAVDLFNYLDESEYSHLSVGVSLFEIYGGRLHDLLNDRKQVKCLEDHKGKVQFPGLSEHRIDGPSELIEYIELGAMSRSTGTTSRNADSSRSHAVLQLHLRKTVGRKENVEHGRLCFIDLAGSERGADTANYSRATRLEGAEINTSLLALKEVIRARARGGSMTHVPFRGSKLTQVLKESFVGNKSRCLMIACVAPDLDSCEQTLNTLRYADRVKERNAETGALPSRFKRGGRRRTSAMTRSTASISSIVSTSDNSIPSHHQRKKKGDASSAARKTAQADSYEDDSFSDNKSSSVKESGAENTGRRRPFAARETSHATVTSNQTLPTAASEDDTDALLAAVLSEDVSTLVSKSDSEAEVKQANSLVDELVATHESFLSAVLGMVQDEIEIVLKMKKDPSGLDTYGAQLESMLQNQSSLIRDLRECFQTYESIQATELGEQLMTHRTVLTAILDIVKDEIALARELDPESSESDELVEFIENLQNSKLTQISELQACFSGSNQNCPVGETVESSGPELLLSESFQVDGDEGNLSEGSFEDLRV